MPAADTTPAKRVKKRCRRCGLPLSNGNLYTFPGSGRSCCRNCHQRRSLAYARSKNSLAERQAEWEKKFGYLPVSAALHMGIAFKCPSCHVLHGGLRFAHVDHRPYCSSACFRSRPPDA